MTTYSDPVCERLERMSHRQLVELARQLVEENMHLRQRALALIQAAMVTEHQRGQDWLERMIELGIENAQLKEQLHGRR